MKPISDADENGSLNYHTTHKNDLNLLQKWWWSVDGNFANKNFFSDEEHFTLGSYVNKQNCCICGPEDLHLMKGKILKYLVHTFSTDALKNTHM